MAKSPFPDDLTQDELDKMDQTDRETHYRHGHSVEMAETIPSPRMIKSHLPFQVLPQDLLDKAKVVYVARRPWDACASFHNHVTQAFPFMYNFQGSFADFAGLFRQEQTMYGSYWNHLQVIHTGIFTKRHDKDEYYFRQLG